MSKNTLGLDIAVAVAEKRNLENLRAREMSGVELTRFQFLRPRGNRLRMRGRLGWGNTVIPATTFSNFQRSNKECRFTLNHEFTT